MKKEVPQKMKDLKRDRRNLPIPFVVLIDTVGKPHFKINDTRKQHICIDKMLCGICGKKLRNNIWLIGGPLSAFHPSGGYVDTPVHGQCGEYALQMCPYLSNPNYNTDKLNLGDLSNLPDHVIALQNQTIMQTPFFVYVRVSGFDVNHRPDQSHFIRPVKPYLDVQYWHGGKQITKQEAMILET